jgi:hypothetical protein
MSARFEVALWCLWSLPSSGMWRRRNLFRVENSYGGGISVLWNVGEFLPYDTASHLTTFWIFHSKSNRLILPRDVIVFLLCELSEVPKHSVGSKCILSFLQLRVQLILLHKGLEQSQFYAPLECRRSSNCHINFIPFVKYFDNMTKTRYTNAGRLFGQTTKFCRLALKLFTIIIAFLYLHTDMCIILHVPNIKAPFFCATATSGPGPPHSWGF